MRLYLFTAPLPSFLEITWFLIRPICSLLASVLLKTKISSLLWRAKESWRKGTPIRWSDWSCKGNSGMKFFMTLWIEAFFLLEFWVQVGAWRMLSKVLTTSVQLVVGRNWGHEDLLFWHCTRRTTFTPWCSSWVEFCGSLEIFALRSTTPGHKALCSLEDPCDFQILRTLIKVTAI